MANYIGKVAAVVTANVSDVAPKLNASARDWDRYGKSVQGTLDAARRNARAAFDQIFTGQQRLERAFAAARNSTLRIDTREGEAAIRRLVQASDELARPLASAQKQYSSLSATIQGEFARAFSEATNAARTAQSTINETGRLGEQAFERYKRRVDEAIISIRRLNEANSAVTGLATGRELRFQQAGFASELQRTAALQSQASSLPAAARASGALGQLVELQRREAEEASRLLAVLESIRNTRRGDAAAAQANLDAQTQKLAQVNSQLERQVALYSEVELRQRQSAAAAAQAAGRRSATELNRRDGVFARRSAAAFDESTAGLVSDPELARRQRELERANRLRAEVSALPADAQAALENQRQQFENTATSAEKGAVAIGTLAAANDRLAASVENAREASADQQRRREVASSLLPPVIDVPSEERQRADLFGRPLDDSVRRLGVLQGAINSVKGQIDQLPIPLQARFIPAIAEAEAQFTRLQASGTATAAQIAAAASTVSQLRSQVTAAARAAELFGTTFRDFAEAGNVRGAAAGLEFLRGELLRATGSTREAERALDDYAEALQRAASTPGGFADQRAELDRLRQAAVEAISSAEGVGRSPGQINRRLERVGDVARGSFGGAGLAVQQLVFGIDDFFSVTGDLDQRIRAAGNNISQLGFILGGTAGLFAGVAVSIAGQGVAALIKWANAGVGAADRTKSLNDALQRQKTLVEQLAESFSSVADAITGITLSRPAQQARSLRRELSQVSEQQRDLVVGRVADLDPEVIRQRSIQRARQRDIESSSSVDQIVRLQRQLAEAQAREREQLESIRIRGERGTLASREIRLAASLDPRVTPDSRAEGARLFDALSRFFESQARSGNPLLLGPGVRAQGRNLASEELNRLSGLGTIQQIEAFRRVQRQAEQQQSRGEISQTTADSIIGAVESIVQKLEFQANLEFERAAAQIRQSAQGFALAIEGAGQDAADGILRGVSGAADFQAALDNTGLQLERLFTDLNAARQLSDPAARQRELERVQSQIADVVNRQQAILEASREIRLGRSVGGERTAAALSGLQGNERFANELAGLQASLAAAIDAELEARRSLESAIASGDEALQKKAREELSAAQAASELAAAAGEAAVTLESAFARIRESVGDIESAARALADQAQRDLIERLPVREGGLADDQLRANRDQAEIELIAARRRVAELQNQLDAQRAAIGDDPRVQEIDRRVEELRNEAQEAAARARIDGVAEDPAAARARADELSRLEEERAKAVFDATSATRDAIDEELRLIEARRRAVEEAKRAREFEAERGRRRDPVGDPFAGLDSLESQQATAARQFAQTIANINAAADLIAQNVLDAANGLPDAGQNEQLRQNEAERRRALSRVENEQLQALLQATSALQRFEEALNEASQQVLADARQAEARAAESQRRQRFLSTPINDFEARNAEVNARRQRDLADQAQLAIDQERSRLEELARQGGGPIAGLVQELSRIDEALAAAQGDDRARLEAERRRVQADIDRQVELSPEVQRARNAANLEADRQAAAAQGRQLFLQQNPLFGAQQELAEQFAAIDAAFEEFARGIIDAAGGLPGVNARVQADLDANERRREAARQRAIEDITGIGLTENEQARRRVQDQLGPLEAQAQALAAQGQRADARQRIINARENLARDAAPLIFGFRDEVANAVLQGPSRAALQVADASTTEGQRELNRLLRGEDSARDVNFVELQKQTELLKAVSDGITALAARLGIAL